MSSIIYRWSDPFEKQRSTLFLIAGVVFVVDAALLTADMAAGTEPVAFGQGLIGTAWTAAFLGLLGFYPGLSDRSRWPSRVGAVFAAVGAVTMAAMAVTSFGYAAGVLGGALSDVVGLFLLGVFPGIVFGFGSFGVASLRTDVYARPVGLLFLLLVLTFLFNLGTGIAGFNPLVKVLGVVCVLALAMLAVGYLLRTGGALTDREGVDASSDASVG